MRKLIAALQVPLDGMIEGPRGELDRVAHWGDPFGLTSEADACLLGGGMHGGYERYWTSVLANPAGTLEFTGRPPTAEEISYADQTPHYVLSTTLQRTHWHVATLVRDLQAVRALKQQRGRAIHAVGGAGLVSSLMNEGLVDELRLISTPSSWARESGCFSTSSARTPWFFWAPSGSGRARSRRSTRRARHELDPPGSAAARARNMNVSRLQPSWILRQLLSK